MTILDVNASLIYIYDNSFVVDATSDSEIEVSSDEAIIEIEETNTDLFESTEQGPMGPPGGIGNVNVSDLISTLLQASADIPNSVLVNQGGTWVIATLDQLAGWLGTTGVIPINAIISRDGSTVLTRSGAYVVTR